MKRVWAIVLLLGVGAVLADCSRCNVPAWGPRACHSDAPATPGQ